MKISSRNRRLFPFFRWANSPIFNNSMFGSAAGSPESGYQLTKGRFGKISVIYDPNDTLVGETFSPFHNAYGFINAAYNYQVRC